MKTLIWVLVAVGSLIVGILLGIQLMAYAERPITEPAQLVDIDKKADILIKDYSGLVQNGWISLDAPHAKLDDTFINANYKVAAVGSIIRLSDQYGHETVIPIAQGHTLHLEIAAAFLTGSEYEGLLGYFICPNEGACGPWDFKVTNLRLFE